MLGNKQIIILINKSERNITHTKLKPTYIKRAKIINDLYRETHLPGRPIYIKGQISNCIYIVKDGIVEIKDDKKVVKTLKEGDFFGALSVIGLTNRFMDAEAKEKTHLYSISVSNLEKIFGENFRTNYILSLINKNVKENAINIMTRQIMNVSKHA